jgi:hypothetical protein
MMADASAATCTIGHIGWDRSNVPHATTDLACGRLMSINNL